MNSRVDVDALFDRFRDWLDSASAESELEGASERGMAVDKEPIREFGLIDLIEEFTALRHELKLQTKSSPRSPSRPKQCRRRSSRRSNTSARSSPGKNRRHGPPARRVGPRPGRSGRSPPPRRGRNLPAHRQIAELAPQSLSSALDELLPRPVVDQPPLAGGYHQQVMESLERNGASRHALFDSFAEGFGLIRKRLGRLMAAEQLEPIACVGRAVDPELMTVLEVVDSPESPPGTVTKELRRGYKWRGRVLRYAEVQAVRTGLTLSEPSDNGQPGPPPAAASPPSSLTEASG